MKKRITYNSLMKREERDPECAEYLDWFSVMYQVARVANKAGRRGYKFQSLISKGCIEKKNLDSTLEFE